MAESTEFRGFAADGLAFFAELAAHNDRTWFERNKRRYLDGLIDPARLSIPALGQKLDALFGPFSYDTRLNGAGSLMRLQRDVRFSADKSPFKTNLGIVWWQGSGKKMESPGFYFHLETTGATFYGGMHQFPEGAVDAYRQAVVDEHRGSELTEILAELATSGFTLGPARYKRVPAGLDPGHARANLLLHDGLYVTSPPIDPQVVTSPALLDACLEHVRTLARLHRWVCQV